MIMINVLTYRGGGDPPSIPPTFLPYIYDKSEESGNNIYSIKSMSLFHIIMVPEKKK